VNATFAQMEAFFTHEYGYHPPRDLPFMPKEKHTWCRVVHKVPFQDLTTPPDWDKTTR